MLNHRDVAAVTKALVSTQAYQAVKFVSPSFVVRATKPRRGCGKQWDKRDRSVSLVLTYGAPNHRERAFLKARGGIAPARVQLRDFPKPR